MTTDPITPEQAAHDDAVPVNPVELPQETPEQADPLDTSVPLAPDVSSADVPASPDVSAPVTDPPVSSPDVPVHDPDVAPLPQTVGGQDVPDEAQAPVNVGGTEAANADGDDDATTVPANPVAFDFGTVVSGVESTVRADVATDDAELRQQVAELHGMVSQMASQLNELKSQSAPIFAQLQQVVEDIRKGGIGGLIKSLF